MTKTKRQLRAEAVERLRNTPCAWGGDYIGAILGIKYNHSIDRNKIKNALIDLLTDDDVPEGDAVRELRLWAECDQSHEDPEHVLVERRIMAELADMIERDYVRRELVENSDSYNLGTDSDSVNGKTSRRMNV